MLEKNFGLEKSIDTGQLSEYGSFTFDYWLNTDLFEFKENAMRKNLRSILVSWICFGANGIVLEQSFSTCRLTRMRVNGRCFSFFCEDFPRLPKGEMQ